MGRRSGRIGKPSHAARRRGFIMGLQGSRTDREPKGTIRNEMPIPLYCLHLRHSVRAEPSRQCAREGCARGEYHADWADYRAWICAGRESRMVTAPCLYTWYWRGARLFNRRCRSAAAWLVRHLRNPLWSYYEHSPETRWSGPPRQSYAAPALTRSPPMVDAGSVYRTPARSRPHTRCVFLPLLLASQGSRSG